MRPFITVLCSVLLLASHAVGGQAPDEEFRAAWASRFDWAAPDGDQCRRNIVRIMDALARNHFNAVVFQVRGAAETLYPSTLEPWSPLVGPAGPGFDPLAFALQQAHRRGMQLHAYVNPMPLCSAGRRAAPQDPQHLWHRHGPESAAPWVCVDRDGEPARTEYYYLSAGIPDVHVYLRRVLLDLVRRYDLDGIHFDRIRYPGPQYSHDPISRRRFRGRGNPNRKDWADWQREQLDKLINDLAAEIRAVKPELVVSCAAWGIYNRRHIEGYDTFSSGYHDFYQDTWNWVRLGAMDLLMPMMYWDLADPKPNYDELLRDFARGVGGTHLVGGQRVFSKRENERQIQVTREVGAAGTVLWSFRRAHRLGVLQHLGKTLYRQRAHVPRLPRVESPASGAVLGTVQDRHGQPLTDAWVSLLPADASNPRAAVFSQAWTSSADGRFTFLDIPPGKVRIRVRGPAESEVVSGPVDVRRGQVASVDVTVGAPVESSHEARREARGAAVSARHIVARHRGARPEPSASELLAMAETGQSEHDRARSPRTLQEALDLLDERPAWTDRPPLNVSVHPAQKYLQGMTIVLDPGHGGAARHGADREADMNWRVTRLLAKLLRQAGCRVTVTREEHENPGLAERAAVANQARRADGSAGADLLISIHHNAGGKSANYTSVWYHGEADWSEPDLDVARYVAHALGESLRTDVGLTSPLMSDQQMYRTGFGVLRHCQVPAILLECSFFSHPAEKRRLRDARYNLREAHAIYRGLCEYAYGGRPSQSVPVATLADDGTLRIETTLDDGLPKKWWGADRNRILSSTIRVAWGDRVLATRFDPTTGRLSATLGGVAAATLAEQRLQIHFANLFKHHNWPQRYSLARDARRKQLLCSPLASHRSHPQP